MQIVKLKNNRIKLVAEEGKIIRSYSTIYDEELKKNIAEVEGNIIYLGKNDKIENYYEIVNMS